MRLLTFNTLLRGDVRARLTALSEILERSAYDIVCLQELMYRRNLRLFRGFDHVRASGTVLLQGGLAMLSRHPITQYRFVRFPMMRPARPEHLMRKGAQLATVQIGGVELAIVNTHLSANRDLDWLAGNRYAAIERAELAVLAAAIDTELPVIAVGDFNIPGDSVLLQDFQTSAGMQAAPTGPTCKWMPVALDHVFFRGAAVKTQVVLQEGGLSDHYGVEADIAVASISSSHSGA